MSLHPIHVQRKREMYDGERVDEDDSSCFSEDEAEDQDRIVNYPANNQSGQDHDQNVPSTIYQEQQFSANVKNEFSAVQAESDLEGHSGQRQPDLQPNLTN